MKLLEFVNRLIDRISIKYQSNPDKDKILIIRVDGIGDFFIFIESIKKLKNFYNNKKIGIIASEDIIKYALEKKLCDYGIVLDTIKYQYNFIYRFLKNIEILRRNIYITINPISSRTTTIDNLVNITKAPEKIGIKGCYANQTRQEQEALDFIYTKLFTLEPNNANESDRNNSFLEFLGLKNNQISAMKTSTDKKDKKIIIIGPCTGRKYRQWGEFKYIELIKKLSEIENLQIILVGSKEDKKTCNKIKKHLDRIVKIDDQSGCLSLSQLEERIKKADLVISGETSLTHIAAYVNTQSVCIVGGGHFGRFVPYGKNNLRNYLAPIIVHEPMSCFGCNWNCIIKKNDGISPMPCIDEITTEKVFILVRQLIKGTDYESVCHINIT